MPNQNNLSNLNKNFYDENLNPELVFFDTFSHENNEEINLDLVQFRSPVVIKEIRIIPLGAKVEADFPGGWRLGATNPSSFDVLFYINDLTKSTLNKFTKFGNFNYKESVNIKFVPDEIIPTNSLVLKGKYTVLTLAIFANIINENSISNEEEVLKISHKQNINDNFAFELNSSKEKIKVDNSVKIDPLPEIKIKKEKFIEIESKNKISPNKLKKEFNSLNLKTEIQSISSPTEDFQNFSYEFSIESTKNTENLKKKSLENLNDSESISSLDDENFKKEKIIPSSPLNKKSSVKSVTNESDFEPISPEQVDQQENIEVSDSEKRNYFEKDSSQNDLLFINNLTEKVSDDEISDFNNDEFFENEKTTDPRIDSRTSTNSEDLEAISSEEEYFDKSSNDGEIFEDYSDNEINNIKYKYEFNFTEYECQPIKSLDDVSFTNYGNIWLKKNISDVLKRKNLVKEIKEIEKKKNKDCKWVEYIEGLLPDVNYIDLNDQELVTILINWINIGINFDCAINQEKTAFKIRHLKAGLKLLNTLCQTTSSLIERLLNEKILEKVYLLFFKPYMSFSMKLLLIKTLDYFLSYPIAIEHIFEHKYELESFETLKDEFKNEQKTIYELILILMMKTTETLVSFSLSVLLRKIHLYEFLMDFKEKCQSFSNKKELFIENLKETTTLFKNSNKVFGQRSRYLPAKVQFEIDFDPSTENIMYMWFNHLNFYETIIEILEKEVENENVVLVVLEFLDEVFHKQNGLFYFSSLKCVSLTNRLFKIKIDENESSNLSENEEKNKLNLAHLKLKEFISKLKISLHILELVDQINEIQECPEFNSSIFYDETKLCQLYNKLYSMVFDELGSKCLVKVFCDKKNLNILIKFLSCNRERENNNKTSKSICFHYAINLLVHVIQFSKEKLCELFIKYNEELINLSNILSTSKFSTLSKWLSPLKRGIKINHSEITFKLLTSNLKQHFERLKDLKENCTYRVSPDLISCVQILHWLCVSKEQKNVYCDDTLPENQLKYKYGLIQLYTLKGTTYILTILERLSEIFLKPSHLNSSLISNQGYYLITLFEPCIEILKQTILNLTHSRGSCFKDTSPIKPLLKVYSLMLIFPLQSSFYPNSVKICNEVIVILQSYTQLNVNINEVEDEVFNKSVWTKMVKEVINFTTLKPFNFSHGLYLLSQLLPLPLSVKKTDNSEETTKLLNFRKLWSAHIHVLFNDIENMLQKLVLCLSPLIKCLLKRVSYQLVDLSSHAGIIISKCLISVLDQHISKTDLTESKDNLESVLDLISFLLKFNLFKNAFSCTVNSLNSSVKKDEKFDKTIRKVIDLFKQNQELSEKYAVILSILDSKKELTADNELDLNQIEKLNLHYNSREENICLEEDFDDLSKILDLTKKLNKFDLFNLSKKYLEPNFDVRNKLLILYKNEEPNFEENYKLTNKHKHEPLITKDYSSSIKRPYVAPLRGRGFQRSTNIGGRLHDPFRSRPPNTSRPPSMHVDDFVAMEQNNQNNIKRQKQDFNKFKINQGQRNNQRPVYYNNNFRAPNSRNNNLNNRTSFNRYSNITISYNNNNSLNNNNVNNNTSNNNSNNNRIRKFPETFSVS